MQSFINSFTPISNRAIHLIPKQMRAVVHLVRNRSLPAAWQQAASIATLQSRAQGLKEQYKKQPTLAIQEVCMECLLYGIKRQTTKAEIQN